MKNIGASTDKATNEIVGWYFDHTYVRRDGVLYDEWFSFGDTCRQKITEADIPATATRCEPPIVYWV